MCTHRSLSVVTQSSYISTCIIIANEPVKGKGVFKGGVQGVQTPPEIFRFFLKSEGKEIERKRKKRDVGRGGGGVTS